MKIKGWEKISGFTYKGFCIVNPIHNANEDTYYATILNLNHQHKPKWDMILLDTDGVFTFRIKDNITKHPLAKAHLTKVNIFVGIMYWIDNTKSFVSISIYFLPSFYFHLRFVFFFLLFGSVYNNPIPLSSAHHKSYEV